MALPYPVPLWSRLISLALAIAVTALVMTYPRDVAASVTDYRPAVFALMLWGVAAGFVHGVGFVPRRTVWRAIFHPLFGWLVMGASVVSLMP